MMQDTHGGATAPNPSCKTWGMRPSLRPLHALVLFTLAALSTTAGCGGSFGRLTSAERLPADGRLGGPAPAALKVQTVSASEWASLTKQKVAPACDARRPKG